MKTKNFSKSLLSMLLALVMVLGMLPTMAFAAEEKPDQVGTVSMTMLKEDKSAPSMCDVMFAEKAEVEVRGDNATMTIYVAYPVPAFPNLGTDGTIKDFTISYGGQTYTAESDITSKPMMTVKQNQPGFGLTAGEEIPAQVLTVTLPKAALQEADLPVSAFVNVFMNMDVKFNMALSDLVLEDTAKPEPQPETPADQTGSVSMTMWKDTTDEPSMCDVMFAEKAEVEVRGENATLKMYVAYPVPNFPNLGTDGTIKNFKVTYDGKTYTADSDITSKPKMTVKTSQPGFGLVAGEKIDAQVLTITLPKAALNEPLLPVTAYVNVFMDMDVNFRMLLSDLVLEDTAKPEPQPETPADQTGSVSMTMWKDTTDEPSMCDVMFAEKAEVEVHGENATLKMYVAYPVPNFPNLGTDGTIKNFKVTYDGKTYTADSDITSKPKMTVKTSQPGFGLVAGEKIDAQVLTITLPKAALNEPLLPVTAYVNVFMNRDVNFRMLLSDLVLEDTAKPEPQPNPEPTPDPDPQPEVPANPPVDAVDEATGIKVHANKNVFTESVTLVVDPITKGEAGYDEAAKILDSIGKKFRLYDVHFENQNGEEVQPQGMVTVSYPIPEGYDAAKLTVYRINEDGTKTKVNGTVEDGYYTVIQKSFSTYALVEEGSTAPETTPATPETIPSTPSTPSTPSAPQTGDTINMVALISLLLVSGAAMAVMVFEKKRRSVK